MTLLEYVMSILTEEEVKYVKGCDCKCRHATCAQNTKPAKVSVPVQKGS